MNIFGNKYHLLQNAGCDFKGKSILIILFIISCTTMKRSNTEQKKESLGSKLSVLDDKLELFAKRHHTQIRSPKPTYYSSTKQMWIDDSFETREISWTDGNMEKSIIINPHQTNLGLKSDTWDVIILAWLKDTPNFEKPFWMYYLLQDADVDKLKENIEQLLGESEEKLKSIKPEDLKTVNRSSF